MQPESLAEPELHAPAPARPNADPHLRTAGRPGTGLLDRAAQRRQLDTATRVATVQQGGSIKLDFGNLTQGGDTVYSDVLDLTSKSSRTATLTLSVSGTLAKLVKHMGFYGKAGIQTTNLTLKAGQTQQLAFELSASSKAALGKQQGSLTLTAKLSNRTSQQSQLSMAVAVVDPPSASPSPSPSGSPSPAVSPKVTPAPSLSPSSSPTASPTPTRQPVFRAESDGERECLAEHSASLTDRQSERLKLAGCAERGALAQSARMRHQSLLIWGRHPLPRATGQPVPSCSWLGIATAISEHQARRGDDCTRTSGAARCSAQSPGAPGRVAAPG